MISFIIRAIANNPAVFISLISSAAVAYWPISAIYSRGKVAGIKIEKAKQKRERVKNAKIIKGKVRRAYSAAKRDSNWFNSSIMRQLDQDR